MIVLEGAPALSPFRRDRLQARLQTLVPGLRLVGAWHGYWIDPEPGASPDRAALLRILQANEGVAEADAGVTTRYGVPRLGTLSPWASKATERLRGAGLHGWRLIKNAGYMAAIELARVIGQYLGTRHDQLPGWLLRSVSRDEQLQRAGAA